MKRITDWVHDGLRQLLEPGDWVVDATLGNGYDAALLLDRVSPEGRVFAFDNQARAVEQARQRLAESPELLVVQADHAQLATHLPPEARGRLRAVVFNLGYLPGGDRRSMTRPESTLPALAAALRWLAPGGVLSCTCYPGTPEGAAEARAVSSWFEGVERTVGFVTRIEAVETLAPGPFTLWLEKR